MVRRQGTVRIGELHAGALLSVLSACACNPILGIELGEPLPLSTGTGAGGSSGGATGGGGGTGGGGAATGGAGQLAWVRAAGGPNNDTATDVDFTNGHLLVAGRFQGVASFGQGPSGEIQLDAAAKGQTGFVASYDQDGGLEWVRSVPAGGYQILRLHALGGGGFLLGGAFEGTATFGVEGDPGYRMIPSLGGSDAYVAKYDSTGALEWARAIGGGQQDNTGDVAVGVGQYVLVGGFYGDQPQIDGGPLLPMSTGMDAFLVAFYGNGDYAFSVTLGGAGDEYVSGIASSADGIYVVGMFNDTLVPQAGSPLTTRGYEDAFLARFEPAAVAPSWLRQLGGGSADFAQGLAATTIDGTLRIAGEFTSDPIELDDGSAPDPASISLVGQADVFVASYDGDGGLVWAERVGGPGATFGTLWSVPLDVTLDGNVAIAGRFSDSTSFGGSAPATVTLTAAGQGDIFVASYDADGTLTWARSAGGPGEDSANAVAIGDDGAVYAAGYFASNPCVFGPGEAGETPVPNVGGTDVFVARLAP